MTHRRAFLQKSAALVLAALAGGAASPREDRKNLRLSKVGLQLFSIPWLLEKDFAGAMKLAAQIGFKELEFYGPYPFSTPQAQERWKSLRSTVGFSGSGYFGLDIPTVRKILDDQGLSTPSMHTDLTTLLQNMGPMAEAAHALGQQYVVLPSYETQPGLDGYKRLADQFNEIGKSAAKEGLRFAFHNHGNGLKPMDGVVPLDYLIENTHPQEVFLQMDLYWTVAGGVDPIQYLKKYPGRYRLMHVKDMAKAVRFSGDGGDPKQWVELWPFMADAGSGVMDLKGILSAGLQTGVEHFILERDLVPDPEHALVRSYRYLSTLEL